MGRRKFFIFHCFIAVLFCGILQGNAAQPRATEILERLAAGFRAMDGYGVKFGVVSGDYEARGSYVVEGDSYYLVLGDAEVFADGAVRREVDNRRREVTVTEVDGEQVLVNVLEVAPLAGHVRRFDKNAYAGYEFIDFR